MGFGSVVSITPRGRITSPVPGRSAPYNNTVGISPALTIRNTAQHSTKHDDSWLMELSGEAESKGCRTGFYAVEESLTLVHTLSAYAKHVSHRSLCTVKALKLDSDLVLQNHPPRVHRG